MAEQKVVLRIAPDGTMQISVQGVCGESCKVLTKPIEEALGTVISDSPTDDMYAEQSISQEVSQ